MVLVGYFFVVKVVGMYEKYGRVGKSDWGGWTKGYMIMFKSPI